jgi:hypothetical protein
MRGVYHAGAFVPEDATRSTCCNIEISAYMGAIYFGLLTYIVGGAALTADGAFYHLYHGVGGHEDLWVGPLINDGLSLSSKYKGSHHRHRMRVGVEGGLRIGTAF